MKTMVGLFFLLLCSHFLGDKISGTFSFGLPIFSEIRPFFFSLWQWQLSSSGLLEPFALSCVLLYLQSLLVVELLSCQKLLLLLDIHHHLLQRCLHLELYAVLLLWSLHFSARYIFFFFFVWFYLFCFVSVSAVFSASLIFSCYFCFIVVAIVFFLSSSFIFCFFTLSLFFPPSHPPLFFVLKTHCMQVFFSLAGKAQLSILCILVETASASVSVSVSAVFSNLFLVFVCWFGYFCYSFCSWFFYFFSFSFFPFFSGFSAWLLLLRLLLFLHRHRPLPSERMQRHEWMSLCNTTTQENLSWLRRRRKQSRL